MCTDTSNVSRLPSHHFSYERWGAGKLLDMGIYNRYWSISLNTHIIRKYAVGYIESERLMVRPKLNEVAVMFYYNDVYFWTHLARKEFIICFPELENGLKK